MIRVLAGILAAATLLAAPAAMAQSGPLRIEITEGVIEPMPFAVPDFIPDNSAASSYGKQLAEVVAADEGAGLDAPVEATVLGDSQEIALVSAAKDE